MKIKLITVFVVLVSSVVFSQSAKLLNTFGKFENGFSISISMNGYIYITDSYANELFKYDSLGTMLKYIGGYGWDDSQFDDPVDVYATTLNVYVADKNNNRIQIFDKDLNFLSAFTTKNNENSNLQFAYPTACGVSGQGDLFILDSDNNRILKYNLTGEFLQEIGGVDAGDYSIENPKSFAISKHGNVYVLEENKIILFDQYGNGLQKINLKTPVENINISLNYLILIFNKKIRLLNLIDNLPAGEISLQKIPAISDAAIYGQKLYVLSPQNLLVYKFEIE